MEWSGTGLIISVRNYSETTQLIECVTEQHGRVFGTVRRSKRHNTFLQSGLQCHLTWRARFEDSLGRLHIEPISSPLSIVFSDREALMVLNALCAMLHIFAPERMPVPTLYHIAKQVLEQLAEPITRLKAYAYFEYTLLAETGFSFDWSVCALTGKKEGLAYVSPKTGRAVTAESGQAWQAQLLRLPLCFTDAESKGFQESNTLQDIVDALVLTGYFLTKWSCPAYEQTSLPSARIALLDWLNRQTNPVSLKNPSSANGALIAKLV